MIILVDFASLVGGAALIVGLFLWLILVIFGKGVADQGVVVANFIISILLLIFAIFEIIKLYKESDKKWKKILAVIEIGLILGMMIYGFLIPYNNRMFSYSYTKIPSIIQSTWIVCLIINIVNMLLNDDADFGEIIGVSLTTLITGFCLGQIVTGVLSFTIGVDKTIELYNNVAYYHDVNYENNRENIDNSLDGANKSLEDAIDNLKNQGENTDGISMSKYIMTKDFKENYLMKYGYSMYECHRLVFYNVRYRIVDKVTGKIETIYFDSDKNKFVTYTEEELKNIENSIAKEKQEYFKNIAIAFSEQGISNFYKVKESFGEKYDFYDYKSTYSSFLNGYIIKFYKDNGFEFEFEFNDSNNELVNSSYKLNESYYK